MSRYGKAKRIYRRRLWAGFVDGKLAWVGTMPALYPKEELARPHFDDVREVEVRTLKVKRDRQ